MFFVSVPFGIIVSTPSGSIVASITRLKSYQILSSSHFINTHHAAS